MGDVMDRRLHRRERPHHLRSALVLAATLVSAVSLAACGASGGNPNATIAQVGGPPQTSSTYPGALLFGRVYPKPNVTLTDTSDAPYNIAAATKGQVTMVYFGYTHCPDLCPLNMATASAALGRLPTAERRRINVVFVSTDPDRDTPPVIRVWLDHFDDAFIGLTGSIRQIRQAELETGLPLSFAEHVNEPGGSYTVVHAGYILVYSQDNKAHLEFPAEITPSQEAQDLTTLLKHGWQG
jgi:protein SCO1